MTDKQLAANRANAQNSTGPRTQAGKARASQNARKHGFSGVDFTIVKIEDRDAIDRLRADLINVYQPQNSQELFALEKLALAQHNLLRIARLEAGLGSAALNQALSISNDAPFVPLHEELGVPPEEAKEQNRAYAFAFGFDQMIKQSPTTWALFFRYQAQAERLYRRAVDDLDRLIKLRPHLPEPLPDPFPEIDNDDSPNEPISESQPDENSTSSAPDNEAASAPAPTALPEAPTGIDGPMLEVPCGR